MTPIPIPLPPLLPEIQMRWLRIVRTAIHAKTSVWAVIPKEPDSAPIGEIRWYPTWRRYAFFPAPDTVYEAQCLEDLARICRLLMRHHTTCRKTG